MSKYKPYRFLLYLLLEAGRAIILVLPRPICYLLAHGIGSFTYWVLPKERAKMLKNLTQAFGSEKSEAEIKKIASLVFPNLAKSAVDVFKFPILTKKKVEKLVFAEPEDMAKLDFVFSRGKGLIGLTAHIGNWELVAAYCSMRGYKGRLVGRRIYYEPFNRVLVSLRESVGLKTIYRDGAYREILSQLKKNEWVGILVDQDIDSLESIFVPFFNRSAWTPTAPARTAMATGAGIIPLYMIRKGMRYQLYVDDPIFPESKGTKEETVYWLTEQCAKVTEKYVRQFPEQWVWMHDRWKTRPEMVNQVVVERG